MSESITVKQAKKLYNEYSPFYTNDDLHSLLKSVQVNSSKITKNIREYYVDLIKTHYVNEQIVKSAFIKKYSLHLSTKRTVTIFELDANESRSDICMVNGKSKVFEIKTEYDTYVRLEKQLEDYSKLFDEIYIIIPECQLASVMPMLDEKIGVYTYIQNRLGNLNFNAFRNAKQNHCIDPVTQLNLFTKRQLSSLCKEKSLKVSSKTDMVTSLLDFYNPHDINKMYKEMLKTKYKNKWEFVKKYKNQITDLDYQWFFTNNLPIEIVYR